MAAADWSERTRMLITAAVLVVVNVAVFFFLYRARTELDTINVAVGKQQTELDRLSEQEKSLKDLVAKFERKKEDHKEHLARLPEHPNREQFSFDLTQLESTLKLEHADVSHNNVIDQAVDVAGCQDRVLKDVYTCRMEADFRSLGLLFWQLLEGQTSRIMAVENFSLSARDGGMALTGAKHAVAFSLATYHAKPKAP